MSLPCVAAAEIALDSTLPAAVASSSTGYMLVLHQRRPSAATALGVGVSYRLALLSSYVLLALIVAWSLILTVEWTRDRIRHTGQRGGSARAVLLAAACLWTINLGFGLRGNWLSLKDYNFASRILAGRPPDIVSGEPRFDGNRFRGGLLGDCIIPLPQEYLRGLDRKLSEAEKRSPSTDASWPEFGRNAAIVAARTPIAILVLLSWVATLGVLVRDPIRLVRNPVRSTSREVIFWTPIAIVAAALSFNSGLISPEQGIVVVAPFAVVAVGRVARDLVPWRRTALPALVFISWAVLAGIYRPRPQTEVSGDLSRFLV